MEKVKIKVFSTEDNSYEEIAKELDRLNKEDPFGYYFIGASSTVVLQISKEMFKRKRTFIRSNFFAVDEFIVWCFKNLREGYTFLNSRQEYAFTKEFLRNSKNNDYRKYSKSPSIIKEALKLIQEINKNLKYKDWDMINENLKGTGFLKEIQENLFHSDSRKTIDKAYVYNFFIKNEKELQSDYIEDSELDSLLKDKTLVFYGFLDIPDALREILSRFIKSARQSLFYSMYENDELFEDTAQYLSIFLGYYDLEKSPKSNLKKFNTSLAKLKDENLEQDYVCLKIKELLKEHIEPEKIGVVCQNHIRAKSFAEKMELYGIPYRLRNNIPLIKSRSVNLILLPFLMQSRGYRSEDIVTYMELKGDNKIRDLYLNLKLSYFFNQHIDEVRKNWNERLEKYMDFLRKKIDLIENNNNEKWQKKNIENDIQIAKEETIKINEIFEELREYEIANRDIIKFKEKLEERIDEFRKKIHASTHGDKDKESNGSTYDYEDERRAITKFSRIAYEFVEMIFAKDRKSNDLGSLLKEICYLETYIPTEFFNNTVEIFSLDDARYSQKEYLFVSGFINGEYPVTSVKLLYDDDNYKEIFNIKDPYYKTYRQTKLHLYLSMAKSKKVLFTYFEEDKAGKAHTPSVFLNDFVSEEKEESMEDERMLEIENSLSKTHALSMSMMKRIIPNALEGEINEIQSSLKKFIDKKETLQSYKFNDNSAFSFTQFQNYTECPYKYFAKYLLHVKEQKELSFSLSAIDEGNIMHEALKDFMEKNKDSMKKEYENTLIPELKSIIAQKFDKYVFAFNENYMNLWKDKVMSYAEKLVKKEIKNDKRIPEKFEEEFKDLKIGGIKFNGRIDRIDRDKNENDVITIIDYKPSKIGSNNEHKKYQLYIYILKYKNIESKIKAFFYAYKKASENMRISFENGIFSEKTKEVKLETVEEVFRDFKSKLEKGLFNVKAVQANKKEDPIFKIFDRKYNGKSEYNTAPCGYCPLKNFCNKGEI